MRMINTFFAFISNLDVKFNNNAIPIIYLRYFFYSNITKFSDDENEDRKKKNIF